MWYRSSSTKNNNIDKYNLSLLKLSKDWFESVPENIWVYKSKTKILKSIVVENNTPKNIFIVKKDSKELGKFNNIDDAVKFVEKN